MSLIGASRSCDRAVFDAQRAREADVGEVVIVFRGDDVGPLHADGNTGLEHVEARHGAGGKTVLLVGELALEQAEVLLLVGDVGLIEEDGIEIRLHRVDGGIDGLAQGVVGGVAQEFRLPDRGRDGGVVNGLLDLQGDLIIFIRLGLVAAAEERDLTRVLMGRGVCAPVMMFVRVNTSELFAPPAPPELPPELFSNRDRSVCWNVPPATSWGRAAARAVMRMP